MTEIDVIIAEVKEALAAKEKKMHVPGRIVIDYVLEAFKNCQMQVSAFEQKKIIEISDDCKDFFIAQCRNDAQELMIEINNIAI